MGMIKMKVKSVDDYVVLTVQMTGEQSDIFQITNRQCEFEPNHGWIYCNYPFILNVNENY